MEFASFKRILTAFADTPASIDITKGKLVCEIRDTMIEAAIRSEQGDIVVIENGEEMRATSWIIRRIARLPILADRILQAFHEPENFITPSGTLTDQLDDEDVGNPSKEEIGPGDAGRLAVELLQRRPVGCTSVLYLTSDAGEGKTTLIHHLARQQSEKFKQKETDWLLVPISLGGKPFLRFDDLVVGYLGNRLRFPLFYYEAFMELVKMGVLVPAFDGFEEMFVQSPSGEALSAIGQLMQKMESSGTVLIAARKAYFEFQDMRTQARLFDSIGTSSVVFSRVSLKRWERPEFLAYSKKRGIRNCDKIYESVAERMKSNHPLLTRAVLVKRLLDVASEAENLGALLQQLGNSPNEYFSVFVNAIIEREAQEKWINRTGEPHQPLLSVAEHIDLLSSIAQEMWILSNDSLSAEVLDLLTELFCETRGLSPEITRQVRERTKQHALIIGSEGTNRTFAFDHEEFKNFFLGEAIGRAIANGTQAQKMELLGLLRKGSLPAQAIDSAVAVVRRAKSVSGKAATFLQEVASLDGSTSFTHENVARLLIRVLHAAEHDPVTFSNLSFVSDSLRDLHLENVAFNNCSFSSTSLEHAVLKNCQFESCHFDQIELHSTTRITETLLSGGDILSIIPAASEEPVYDPVLFPEILKDSGFKVPLQPAQKLLNLEKRPDPNVRLLSRLLRCFQFRTHLNQNVVLRKLGPGAEMFIRDVLPKLVKARIIGEEWIARDKQHRYHLSMSMERLHEALRRANGSIDELIKEVHVAQK